MNINNPLDISLCQPKALQLPFKPFTRQEVEAITQAPAQVIDVLWGKVLPERTGDVGFMPGMDWMETFAIFVASKWLHEGSGIGRAIGAAMFVGNFGHDEMVTEFKEGRTFPTATPQGGILVKAPDSAIGNRLNLEVLYMEFKDRLEQVFPSDKPRSLSGGVSIEVK